MWQSRDCIGQTGICKKAGKQGWATYGEPCRVVNTYLQSVILKSNAYNSSINGIHCELCHTMFFNNKVPKDLSTSVRSNLGTRKWKRVPTKGTNEEE